MGVRAPCWGSLGPGPAGSREKTPARIFRVLPCPHPSRPTAAGVDGVRARLGLASPTGQLQLAFHLTAAIFAFS